jgi:hypothetical protein
MCASTLFTGARYVVVGDKVLEVTDSVGVMEFLCPIVDTDFGENPFFHALG